MELYTPQELREKIASNDYGAELCLQHAMLCLGNISLDLEPVISWLENGCDPKEAAKELRIYQELMRPKPPAPSIIGAKRATGD